MGTIKKERRVFGTMHELMVTESILEIALRHAAGSGVARITDLYLVIGDLSSVVDDSVQFYWDIISENTVAAGAKLHFQRIPGRMACLDCGHSYETRESLACPNCGGRRVQIVAGEEFYLEAIDVAYAEDAAGAKP